MDRTAWLHAYPQHLCCIWRSTIENGRQRGGVSAFFYATNYWDTLGPRNRVLWKVEDLEMMFKTNLKEKVTLGTKLRPREVENLAPNPDFFLISLINERSFIMGNASSEPDFQLLGVITLSPEWLFPSNLFWISSTGPLLSIELDSTVLKCLSN